MCDTPFPQGWAPPAWLPPPPPPSCAAVGYMAASQVVMPLFAAAHAATQQAAAWPPRPGMVRKLEAGRQGAVAAGSAPAARPAADVRAGGAHLSTVSTPARPGRPWTPEGGTQLRRAEAQPARRAGGERRTQGAVQRDRVPMARPAPRRNAHSTCRAPPLEARLAARATARLKQARRVCGCL